MSDLVERLRDAASDEERCGGFQDNIGSVLMDEAADEITRLRNEVAHWREARRAAIEGGEVLLTRIAHLERVVAAADAMRVEYGTVARYSDWPSALAYDAVRKGER